MAKRLIERFNVGEAVEIKLETTSGVRWTPGVLEEFAFPGVWVRTDDGGRWFVTNGRRIRKAGSTETG